MANRSREPALSEAEGNLLLLAAGKQVSRLRKIVRERTILLRSK